MRREKMFDVLGLLIALSVFIILTVKGWNICFSVLVSIAIISVTNSMDFFEGLTVHFSKGLGEFAAQWWLIFVLGAVYGKIMHKSGISKNIAILFTNYFAKYSILVILVISAIMSYGGIGTFIIAYTIYPIAYEIFEKTNIPKNLLPATILFCPTTICMTMLPGTPSIQNIIPTRYLGTSIYAAPSIGILSSMLCFALGYSYLKFQAKKSCCGTLTYEGSQEMKIGIGLFSLIPCIAIWIFSFLSIKSGIDSQKSVEIAIFVGIIMGIIIAKILKKEINVKNEVGDGIKGGLQTVMITSCIMGYGAVVKNACGFDRCISYFESMNDNPIVISVIIINIIALITGSSTGSLSLFFENFQNLLLQSELNASQLHRIIAIASGGMDSMPYATGIIVTNDLAKTNIKDTYLHIFVTCAIVPLVCLTMILLGMFLMRGWC